MRFCCKHDFRLLKADLFHQPKFGVSRKGQYDTICDGVEGEQLGFFVSGRECAERTTQSELRKLSAVC